VFLLTVYLIENNPAVMVLEVLSLNPNATKSKIPVAVAESRVVIVTEPA
jgi:hypothetical protein